MKSPIRLLPILLLAAPFPCAAFDFFQPVDPPRPFQVMVHRGEKDQAPENTIPAIQRCFEDGFEWAEVDVRLTKDGHHVIFHDADLDGKSDMKGKIAERTLDELRKADTGAWFAKRYAGKRILTPAELFDLAKGKINLYLDCKEINPELLADEILKAGMERQAVVYDDPEVIRRVQTASQGKVAVMTKWFPEDGMAEWLDKNKVDAVEINADRVTPEIVKAFHDRAIKVETKNLGEWDTPEFWDKVTEAGVDWIQTDIPEEVVARSIVRRWRQRPVRISCHRGANRYAPENTMPAFEKARRIGVEFVEFDVRTTSDGKFRLLHDGKLDRTTNGKGPIREATSESVDALDAGAWFGKPFEGTHLPTLDQLLSTYDDKIGFYFDDKDVDPAELVRALERNNSIDQTVVFNGPEELARIRAINPAIRLMPPLDKPDEMDALVERLHPYAFDTRWEILSPELIDRCHAAGVQVFSDALGRHEKIEDYIKAIESGIDLIQTDHPLRVLRAVELIMLKREATEPPEAAPEKDNEKEANEDAKPAAAK